MKNLIVVLMGGISGERDISFLSGKACSKVLKKKGHKVIELDASGFFIKELIRLKPKIVFNALHGKYGEDGFIQSVLEALKIPYTHSGVIASNIAMNKHLSKLVFEKNSIKVPKYFLLGKNMHIDFDKKMKKNKIKFPIVIKPVNEGSSLGVYICKNKLEFYKNYKKVSKKYNKIIVVGVDKMSSILDYQDRNTCVLFGDGAGAVLCEPSLDYGVIDCKLGVDGSGAKYLNMPAGGSLNPATEETVSKKMHYVKQNGATVFKSAINGMYDITQKIMIKNNISNENLSYLYPIKLIKE